MIAAKELGIQDVILDDLSARKLAETFLLRPVGTLGMLLLAKEENVLSEVKPHLDQLLEKNFRMSKVLYERILRFADER